jgi:hypothetical protein
VIKTICAWCRVHISGPEHGYPVSHGICEPCRERMEKHMEPAPVDPDDCSEEEVIRD